MKRPYRTLRGRIVAEDQTCESIARKINISPQAMSAKICGHSYFTANEMAAIGAMLHFTAEDYYTFFILPTKEMADMGSYLSMEEAA